MTARESPRAMTRRRFLATAGVLAAGGAGALCVRRAWPRAGDAYRAWPEWRDGVPGSAMRLVRAAILGASPHNSQPWQFAISRGAIDVFADESRRLGAPDPLLRELYIGVGCALENLVVAATAENLATRVALFPGADRAHVARVDLERADTRVDALYAAIPRRHTNRGPYDPAAPPDEIFYALRRIASGGEDVGATRVVHTVWLRRPAEIETAREQIVAATEAMIADGQTAGSALWMRSSQDEIRARRDGITVDASGATGFVRLLARVLPAPSPAVGDRYWLRAVRDVQVATAPAFGLLAAAQPDDRAQLVACGRAWQRMHLLATLRGIAMQPLNQLPERDARERVLGLEPRFGRVLADLTDDSRRRAVLMFRLGYGRRTALPSPRRAVDSVLRADGVSRSA